MTKITITYYGMEGEGPTVREAKADAGRKLEKLLNALEECPSVVRVRGYSAIIAVGLHGWGSRLLSYGDDDGVKPGPIYLQYDGWDKQACRVAALKHVATLAWSHDDDDEAFAEMATDPKMTGCPLNHAERRDVKARIMENAAFQRKYRAAIESGANDHQAHAIACGYDRAA